MSIKAKTEAILERSKNREIYYTLAVKMLTVAKMRGLRLIMENPWAMQTYLKANFVIPPSFIDKDRTRRGDYFVKPTAYWFINCEPTQGFTYQKDKKRKTILQAKGSGTPGLCSEERSMISSDYARNFICDNILGKSQPQIQKSLFD